MSLKNKLIQDIIAQAKKLNKKIVFAETDSRVLEAALYLKQNNIVQPIIIGNKDEVTKLNSNYNELNFVKPSNKYANIIHENRRGKIDIKESELLILQPNYFATCMLYNGEVDGMVCGATYASAETFRPALQIIKTKESTTASTYFLMIIKEKPYIFADCALNINPGVKELAEIAISSADSAKHYLNNPKVAMLSFSTNNSATHEFTEKVRHATHIVKEKRPDINVDGEMQLDVAIVKEIAESKFSDSKIKGDANVLIFPDLNSGNIGYKLVERFAGALAIGPISQGLNKPVNDLSRGCSVEDIIIVSAITAIQSK